MTVLARRAGRLAPALLPALLSLGLAIAAGRLDALPAAARGPAPVAPVRAGPPLLAVGGRSAAGAVASDTEASSRAAAAVLAAGGNAIDAAVAGGLAVGAAAPGSSGLGGQAWMVVHTAAGEDVAFLSPLRAPPVISVARARAARNDLGMTGPLAATAPGMVATLARAHGRFGTRPWAELVAPAIAIAEAGATVSESERLFLLLYRERIAASPALAPLYLTGRCDGNGAPIPVPVGHRVVLPGLARTLRRLAEAGPDDFYRGALASEMAADLAKHSAFLRAGDLARVPASIVEARPVRGRYRDLDVLSLPIQGGGALVLETLHILDAFPSELLGSQAWARTQAIVESVRIAFADVPAVPPGEEIGDGPEQSPWLRPERGVERARLISLGRALPEERLPSRGAGSHASDRETTHLSVVDREGNAVSLTLSLGRSWGSTYVTPGLGFPYNSFLEGYDLDNPGSPAYLRPNAPLTTAVAPTIFLREGRPVLVLGGAGSSRITSAIANVAVGVFDRGLGVAEAVAAPRASWSDGAEDRGMKLEAAPPIGPEDVELLRAAGYADLETYAPGPDAIQFGAVNAVGWDAAAGAWEAGAEPRRDGAAAVPAATPSLAASLRPGRPVSSPLGMVVTSSPEASRAGVRMLENGGNAVDAAVAAAFALTASDPGGSGLGGQTWMVLRLASGQERAVFCPARAPLRIDLAKMKAARQGSELWGPMATAVPTTVATLAHALRRYGTMSPAEVLGPAIEAAEGGYRLQPFEYSFLSDYTRRLFDSEVLYPVYLTGPTGESGIPDAAPIGSCVKLPALADTLRRLAAAGLGDFYTGQIAARLEEDVRAGGGFLSRSDLARVPASVVDTAPVRGTYRGRTVLSVPSPAGGSVLVMALQILDELPPATLAAPGLVRGHALVEAGRLARAEAIARGREKEVTEGPLLSEQLTKDWAARQAARIRPDRALSRQELLGEHGPKPTDRGTSQISVVDAAGNAVSLTQSLGRYFGATWAPPSLGFLLNAFVETLDSPDPASPGYLRPGAAAPLPVAPFLFVRDDRVALVAGTGGSSRIPTTLLNLVAGLYDGGQPPEEAYAAPRVIWEDDLAGPRVMVEIAPPIPVDAEAALKAMGYENVWTLTAPGRDSTIFGGIHAVLWDEESSRWQGFVDGRRAGVAAAPARIAPRVSGTAPRRESGEPASLPRPAP
ncbi:MAG: gamma-glutamyltransferase [Holophagales bacterium]|nr:gamma-glutamyltransferase [Holophagales bacterium]